MIDLSTLRFALTRSIAEQTALLRAKARLLKIGDVSPVEIPTLEDPRAGCKRPVGARP